MSFLVLSVNAGSSSLKISLYSVSIQANRDTEPVELLLTSSISSIFTPPAKFSFRLSSNHENASIDEEPEDKITDHASAFSRFLEVLQFQTPIDKKDIRYICHRVVHGGDFHEPVQITDESYRDIETLSDLAPLHNGGALSVIRACISSIPGVKSIAYFDTMFHQSLPLCVPSYAIDQETAKKRGLKKYGFHGLSYSFILREVSKSLHKSTGGLNLIVLHLGSGASACAIKQGKSIDTSMGLTPLNGLPGATRSGSVDPSLIFHYTNKAGRITHDLAMTSNIHVTRAEDILNQNSGWKAITGTTDFGVITSKAELDNPDPETASRNPYRLAFDLVVDRILHYIGSYHLKLNGEVDALVFAGGIGERGVQLRSIIGERVKCLGYPGIDDSKNHAVNRTDKIVVNISASDGDEAGRLKEILVCKTDEQNEMARQCALDKNLWSGER